ncbi:hypothetical protein M752DRAFT_274550 [Aspergillus phoenicis ATCC 13157]|nr:hypothetical protein M752DRAFT_274550 [Aspergillus phoenicis ATCC 13157]
MLAALGFPACAGSTFLFLTLFEFALNDSLFSVASPDCHCYPTFICPHFLSSSTTDIL